MTEQGMETHTFKSMETIFSEGDPGDAAYIIASGSVEICKGSERGGELVLALRKQGSMIGEMALIDQAPRMATARAIGPTTLIVIPAMAIDKLLAKTDIVVRTIISTLIERLRIECKKNVTNTL